MATPTEVLIKVLEMGDDLEEVFVIYRLKSSPSDDGVLGYNTSIEDSVNQVGALEVTKVNVIRSCFEKKSDDI